jgi:subtilisin family serine protease
LDKNGDGTTVGLLRALSHVTSTATPGKSLINLSLSGPRSRLVEEAIKETAKEHNIPMFVSAGNTGDDACKYLPAASSHVFTVGATDNSDTIAYYSAVGDCVRMYAPGTGIISAWASNNTASMKLDGTSMANPHVAGIAASLLSKGIYSDIEILYSEIENRATKGALTMSMTQIYGKLPIKNNLAFAG